MTSRSSRKGARGLRYTAAYLASMTALYVGERLVPDLTAYRVFLALLAALGVGYAIVGRVLRCRDVGRDARRVERIILGCYVIGLAAILLYALQADFMMDWLRARFDEPRSADHYQGVFATLWVVVWICAIAALVFVELSYAPMDTERTVDLSRVRRSLQSALLLSLTVCLVFALNYVVNAFDEKADLSYFKTTRPSDSSRKMVRNLSAPFEVTLFFPAVNEVLDEVRAYFDGLEEESKFLRIRVVDQVLEPKLAKDLSVSGNGTVVLTRGKQHHQIRLNTKLRRAKKKLKKLDSEFQTGFMKLARHQKVAYFTVGHEERGRSPRDNVRGSSVRGLRKVLQKLNFAVKNLGLAQGLASEIPKDASVVFIIGPRKELSPPEVEALKRYLRGGGHALIALDAEADVALDGLLGPFGLKYTPTTLAVKKPLARRTFTKADRQIIVTNRYGAHPSVKTLSRRSNEFAVVFPGAGHLAEIPPTGGDKVSVRFTVHSLPLTFNDVNGNFLFDRGKEKRRVYELAAAVTGRVAGAAGKNEKKRELRLIVLADSDAISDGLMTRQTQGNALLMLDALRWLSDEEEYIGATTSEEDVRILHTRKEDQVWFYLTIFAMPALVLAGGLFYTRRRRKKQ